MAASLGPATMRAAEPREEEVGDQTEPDDDARGGAA
jgi:hypothetical protein